jgi:putative membrane protein
MKNLKQMKSGMTMIAGAVLLSGGLAFAQMSPGGGGAMQQQQPANPTATNPSTTNTAAGIDNNSQTAGNPMQDKDFVHTALQGGMAEVQLGQLAAQKGSSDDVKQFGQRMVDDHSKLGDAMKPIAQQLGVSAPKDLPKKDRQLLAKLQGLSGQEFDNTYIAAMVKDHKKDDSDFKAEASMTQNPQLRQIAQQGDQLIDQHLQMIEQIAKSHNLMNDKGKMTSGD